MFYRYIKVENLNDESSVTGDFWLCDMCGSELSEEEENTLEVIDRAAYWSDEAIGVRCDECGYEA